jgi:hypothetical protein
VTAGLFLPLLIFPSRCRGRIDASEPHRHPEDPDYRPHRQTASYLSGPKIYPVEVGGLLFFW